MSVRSNKIISLLPLVLFAAGEPGYSDDANQDGSIVRSTLNGLTIVLDSHTGGLLRLSYDGPGRLLDTEPARAGMLDLAYPIEKFEPLRLASRYSQDAQITATDQAVTVAWKKLGASRSFDLPGTVSAVVRFKAAPDGRSVILTCEIENHAEHNVRQVLFPDLAGILPFAGEDETEFRSAGLTKKIFQELRTSDIDRFYARPTSFAEYKAGGMFDPMILRWLDLGSLRGGFSLFPKRWSWDPQVPVLLERSARTGKLRLMCAHDVTVRPGDTWTSGAFWLTSHKNGWAKGIEPYRRWARRNMRRKHPVPRHVRDGLGFRSVWMCQNQPDDPDDAVWTFQDLVPLAKEAKEHGLDEMVLWAWNRSFVLPFPPPYPHLGTEQDLIQAVKQCKAIGVNVAPFVSVLQADKNTAPRYGLTVRPGSGNWTYHTELVPRFRPPYASAMTCVQADTTNPKWQRDVLDSCKHLIDNGITSLCWDQYLSVPKQPNLNTLTMEIRALAAQRDPEATFGGELLRNIENDCEYLDYTWNWGDYDRKWRDYNKIQPLVSVFPTPRINVNINTSAEQAKCAFADNLYLNVWPTKPDGVNGSDWIANHPALSSALKQCAKLRARFLPYFTDGFFIGDCILAEPCPRTHVSAYVLPDRVLVILINTGEPRPITLDGDLHPWLASPSGKYSIKSYDADGNTLDGAARTSRAWQTKTPPMQPLDMMLFELKPD